MPIFPPLRKLYRDRNHERDRTEVLERYGYRCADCGRSALELGSLVLLHLSHENHDPRDRRKKNRVCRCTACHNRHDAEHKRAAKARWYEWLGQLCLPGMANTHVPTWVRKLGRAHDKRSTSTAVGAVQPPHGGQ